MTADIDIESEPWENHPAVEQWNKALLELQEEEEEKEPEQIEEVIKRSCVHQFFNLLRLLTIGAALEMVAGQFLNIYIEDLGFVQFTLRLYVMVICILFVFNEMEIFKIILHNALLQNFVSRGLFYVFIGLIGMEGYDLAVKVDPGDVRRYFIFFASWSLISCGITYFLLGLLCFQRLLHKARADYEKRVEEAKIRMSSVS